MLNKIKSNEGMYEYLLNNSRWYVLIYRNEDNFKLFEKEFKEFKKNKQINKINEAIDNIDLITSIMNMK